MNSRDARERVMDDLRSLAGDAEELLRATADDVSETASQTRERLAKAIENAKATYADLQTKGVKKAKQAMETTDEAIRTHPYESVAVAFVVGLAAGAIFTRSRR